MNTGNVSTLARRYFGAYVSKERKVVEDLLSDDFTFTSPYDDHIDRTTYFERCWANSDKFRDLQIEKLLANASEAFVRYEVELKTGGKFRNTEYLRFEGDKLKEVEVYFGSLAKGDGAS